MTRKQEIRHLRETLEHLDCVIAALEELQKHQALTPAAVRKFCRVIPIDTSRRWTVPRQTAAAEDCRATLLSFPNACCEEAEAKEG